MLEALAERLAKIKKVGKFSVNIMFNDANYEHSSWIIEADGLVTQQEVQKAVGNNYQVSEFEMSKEATAATTKWWSWSNERENEWEAGNDYFGTGAPNIDKIEADENPALDVKWSEFKSPSGDNIIIDSWSAQVYVWGPKVRTLEDAKNVVKEWLIDNVGKFSPFGAANEKELDEILTQMFNDEFGDELLTE